MAIVRSSQLAYRPTLRSRSAANFGAFYRRPTRRFDSNVTKPRSFRLYVRPKEAVLSSQIEGTQSSLQDLLAAEARLYSPETPKDVDEVVNYVSAMNYGLARLGELPVSTRLIHEIHEKLLKGVRGYHLEPGELRRTQNWIGPGGCTLADASFVPPRLRSSQKPSATWKNSSMAATTCLC
jgi:Fic family protein